MGTWRRPSWTPTVWRTIWGKMVESRDQGLRTRFSLRRFMTSIRASSLASTSGPVLTERDTSFSPSGRSPVASSARAVLAAPVPGPADDELVARLLLPGAQAHRRLSPGGLGLPADGGLTLATAVGMVAGVHRRAAHGGAPAEPAGPPGLPQGDVLVVDVAQLADGGGAAGVYPAQLAGGEA